MANALSGVGDRNSSISALVRRCHVNWAQAICHQIRVRWRYPIVEGSDAAQLFRNVQHLAQRAERWGHQRYWLAENHTCPIDRALASDQSTVRALRRGLNVTVDQFPQDILKLMQYFQPVGEPRCRFAGPACPPHENA